MKPTTRKTLEFTGAALIVLLMALVVLVTLAFNLNRYRPRIEATVSESLGVDFRIEGDLRLSLRPDLTISVTGIRLSDRDKRLLSVHRLEINPEITTLLSKEIRIRSLEIEGLGIMIRQGHGGWRRVLKTLSRLVREHADTALPIRSLAVMEVSVTNGGLVYSREETGTRLEMEELCLTVGRLAIVEEHRILEGNLVSFARNVVLAGDVFARRVSGNGIELNNFGAGLSKDRSTISLHPVRVEGFGTEGNGAVSVDTELTAPRFSLTWVMDDLSIPSLSEAFDVDLGIDGALNINVDMHTSGVEPAQFLRNLEGSFSMRGRGLIFQETDLDELLRKFRRTQRFTTLDVGGLLFLGPFGPLFTKSYDYAGTAAKIVKGKSEITRLVSDWRISASVATTEDAAFSTKEHRIVMVGSVDIANMAFEDFRIAIVDERGCAEYSQAVIGTFENPDIRTVPFVTGTVLGPVRTLVKKAGRTVLGSECRAIYQGSVPHPERE